jgi:hypothetical protein
MHYIEVKKSSLKGVNARELKFVPSDERKKYEIGDTVRINIITDRGTLIATKEKRIVSILGSNPFIKSGKVLLGLSDE